MADNTAFADEFPGSSESTHAAEPAFRRWLGSQYQRWLRENRVYLIICASLLAHNALVGLVAGVIELLSLNLNITIPRQLLNFALHVRWFNFYFGTPISIMLTSAVIWLALLLIDRLTRWPEELLLADMASNLKATALSAARHHLWKLFSLLLYLPLLLSILAWMLAGLLWPQPNMPSGFKLDYAAQFFHLDYAAQFFYPLVEIFLLVELLLSMVTRVLHITARLVIGSAVYCGLGYWISLLLIYGIPKENAFETTKFLAYLVVALLGLGLLALNRRVAPAC